MNTKTENKKRSPSLTPAVEQAAVILKYLSSEPRIKARLTEISKIVGINKSKTYAILGALQNAGFVSKDTETKLYSLGSELIPIGRAALTNIDYQSDAKPFLKKLAQETMCTVMLGIISDEKLIIISKQSSGQEVDSNLDIGSTRDVFYKAHGKVILASLPEAEKKRLLSGDDFFYDPELGMIENSTLRKEIIEIKEKGYAMNTGWFSPMIKALSSVVIGPNNHAIGAIILIGLINKSDISKFGKKLVETARDLSNALGARKKLMQSP